MSHSVNEVAALAHKAARGAGFPPAQAELFGKATALHLADKGAPAVIMEALENPSDSPILRLPLLIEDILRILKSIGPEIELSIQDDDIHLAPIYARLLPLHWKSIEVETRDDGPAKMKLEVDPAQSGGPSWPPRLDPPDALLAKLTVLANATLVPQSSASRAGAGAGDIDND